MRTDTTASAGNKGVKTVSASGKKEAKTGTGAKSPGVEMICCVIMLVLGIISLIGFNLSYFILFLICAFILSPFNRVLFQYFPEKWNRTGVRIAMVAVIIVCIAFAAIMRASDASAAQGEQYFWGIMDWIF